jgi:hypothetical protein
MDRCGKDTNCNFWTLLFFSLLLLFMFASAGRNGNEYPRSAGPDRPYELVSGNISGHLKAVISPTVRIPEYQRLALVDQCGTGHGLCSEADWLDGYNQSTALHFTQVNMERLSIRNIRLIFTCFHAGSSGDDDIPVSA